MAKSNTDPTANFQCCCACAARKCSPANTAEVPIETKKRFLKKDIGRIALKKRGCLTSGSTALRPSGITPFTAQVCNNKGVNALCPDGLKAYGRATTLTVQ